MAAESLNQLLLLYSWFALAALLLFLAFIARFYERFSGENTRYRLFLFTLACYAAGWVRYASIDPSGSDAAGDLALGVGGVLLLIHSLYLDRLMMRSHGADAQGGSMFPAASLMLALSMFGLLSDIGLIAVLIVLGRLSGRLGAASGVEAHHRLFYLGSVLIALGLGIVSALQGLVPADWLASTRQEVAWVLIIDGLPALGITLGVLAAWRYWSWVLAERS